MPDMLQEIIGKKKNKYKKYILNKMQHLKTITGSVCTQI